MKLKKDITDKLKKHILDLTVYGLNRDLPPACELKKRKNRDLNRLLIGNFESLKIETLVAAICCLRQSLFPLTPQNIISLPPYK